MIFSAGEAVRLNDRDSQGEQRLVWRLARPAKLFLIFGGRWDAERTWNLSSVDHTMDRQPFWSIPGTTRGRVERFTRRIFGDALGFEPVNCFPAY